MSPTEELYAQHHRALRRWAERRFGPEMCEDVVQEAFLQVHRNNHRLAGVDDARRWLFGTAKYVGAHMLRAASAGKRGGDLVVDWSHEAEQAADEAPAQGLALYVEQLRAHFGDLGPSQRAALTGVSEGLTASEVAERQGCTLSAVTMSLSLGRRRLREKLQDQDPASWV